ncbi:M42 family metallopeptidase [Guggenheimella bovis]
MKNYNSYLKDILSIPSPTGHTKEVMDYIEKTTRNFGFDVTRTKKGAVQVRVKGKDSTKARLIAAHCDTLGGMVREIKSNGRIKFINVGGQSYPSIEGENCLIHTYEGKTYEGTAMPVKCSVHLFPEETREEKRTKDTVEIRIDEEVSSKEDTEKLGIEVGNIITFDTRTIFTESGFIKSRYLDDKCCGAILLTLLENIKTKEIELNNDAYFMFSDFEEVGHGIYDVPETIEEVLSVDIGCVGEGQQASPYEVTIFAKDGSTPYHEGLTAKLRGLAKEHEIPYNIDIVEHYGSDASAAIRQGKDMRFALIGPGVEATHHYERTHQKAVEATYDLLLQYVKTTVE